MCGRFTLTASPQDVAAHFDLAETPEFRPRYNIAPGQPVAIIRRAACAESRLFELHTWGLVPAWAKDRSIGQRMINARSETAAEKPAFRSAFRHRRCLIPADGFYEWSSRPGPEQPYHVSRPDGSTFGFAALWEQWTTESGERLTSCAILTTDANRSLRSIHQRMPVILDPADYPLWLDPAVDAPEQLRRLLVPCPEESLVPRPVGQWVNDTRHDGPECIAPAEPRPGQAELL